MTNILNHNRSVFNFIPNKNDYWDIQLHIDQESNNSNDNIDNDNTTKCLAAYINTNNDDCINLNGNNEIMELVSNKENIWEDAINNGVNLDNIGLTGMDCDYIEFDKDTISDEEFYDLFINSTLEIEEGDYRLHLLKINGNNKLYDYSVDITKSPTNSEEKVIKLNGGFFQGFFWIGDGCDYRVLPSYLLNEWCLQFKLYPVESFENTDETQINPKKLNDVNKNAKGCFFYIGTRAENKLYKYYNNIEEPSKLIKDLGLNQWYDEFSTNNKHITYNRTKEGFKANNPPSPENDSITIRHEHKNQKLNYFTLMNRTPSGYTAETIENLEDNKKEYDVLADLYENALSFQITDDGEIGYKYLVKSCENNPTYKIESEWSSKGIVEFGKWSTISVRIIPILPHKRMRLMFYVNNKLYLCSKELPLLDLRELNDIPSKQESVPFNISIGGGTQGLIDVIYDDYKNIPKETLYLAKEFGGSFIGYFKEFKFFNCSKYYHY